MVQDQQESSGSARDAVNDLIEAGLLDQLNASTVMVWSNAGNLWMKVGRDTLPTSPGPGIE
jgi:hypothetical protein